MAFEICRVDNDTFATLLTADVVRQIRDLVFMPSDWKISHDSGPTAIDRERGCVLLGVRSADKMNARNLYLLLQGGEFALIEERGFDTYCIEHISAGMNAHRAQTEADISAALRTGGMFVDRNPDNIDILAVNEARFLN